MTECNEYISYVSRVPEEGIGGFECISSEKLPEIEGFVHVMRHRATGARLMYLENDDENKSFTISFKTPPEDSTGVFHILEHSVLCGSDKFPVKEPFVNLLKTSMQTFLNAMTFPDKTMYPVASTSETDLLNLMDVYVDAVFHPAIYTKPDIFKQEGWHYEIESPEAPLTYNGVVFNEMKGALSNPESVLYRYMNKALFPDTCYAVESGGDPREIPQLTYEQFIEMHKRHYRVDNSYTVLYGDMNIERVLSFLDERYTEAANSELDVSKITPIREIYEQAPLICEHEVVSMITAPENACMGLGYVIGNALDTKRLLACSVLIDALLGGNESPIKRALLDAGIAGDASAFLVDAQLQPVAVIELQNTEDNVAETFRNIVVEESRHLVDEGIPRELLESSLEQLIFASRECDYGMADGVALAMTVMSGWLYDETDPALYLRYEDLTKELTDALSTSYYEDLLRELILESQHYALIEIKPQDAPEVSEEAIELAEHKATMTEQDIADVMQDVVVLRQMQEAVDTPEQLATLPRLRVSDIKEAKTDELACMFDAPYVCRHYDLHTRNINYVYYYFGLNHITWQDLPYVGILCSLLGKLATQDHSALELDSWVRSHLGSLNFGAEMYTMEKDPDEVHMNLVVSVSALSEQVEHLTTIPSEVWGRTLFNDVDKIKNILIQRRIRMEQSFMNNGHAAASSRVSSYYFASGVLQEYMTGVDFYRFLVDLIDNFNERSAELCERLEMLRASIFVANDVSVSFVGSSEDCMKFWECGADLGLMQVDDTARAVELAIPSPVVRNEAFIIPGDVVFTAAGTNATKYGFEYSGMWSVIGKVMTYDYLWNEVRVKGGAYGTGMRSFSSGSVCYHSYRDPRIDETFARFDAAGEWLSNAEITDEDMEGYIISTVAGFDAPVKAQRIARRQDLAIFSGREEGYRERLRKEMLKTTQESIRSQGAVLTDMVKNMGRCVFGNEEIIRSADADLEIITLLA